MRGGVKVTRKAHNLKIGGQFVAAHPILRRKSMPEIIIICGPPGAGKSTLAKTYENHVHISQDDLGKENHWKVFNECLLIDKSNIVIDRMNFSKNQRGQYLIPAKNAGYKTKIIVLHENFDTCLERMKKRENHPTIKDEKTARKVLNFFYSKYERPTPDEADEIEFRYPDGDKKDCIVVDLDGTLCQIDHRLHFVRGEGKKNWKAFFEALKDDTPNFWCQSIITGVKDIYDIVLCSGRTDNYEQLTMNWLSNWGIDYNELFMRKRNDFRPDYIVKEVILDFEILTRYKPYFFIDDRSSVVKMWRSRGFTCLQCAKGDF